MPDLNANIILQGSQNALAAGPAAADAVNNQLLSAQKFASQNMALKDQAQEQSDSGKINQVAQSLSANSGDPDYSDKLVKALTAAGVSQKAILSYQKAQLGVDDAKLDHQLKVQQISEGIYKQNAAARAEQTEQINASIRDLDTIVAPLGDNPTPDQVALATTQAQIMLDQEVKDKVITPQQQQKMLQQYFPKDPQTGKPKLNVQAIKSTYSLLSDVQANLAAKTEHDLKVAQTKKADADADAAGTVVTPIQVAGADGKMETHIAVTDKRTNKTRDTGAIAAPKASGQNQLPSSPEDQQKLADDIAHYRQAPLSGYALRSPAGQHVMGLVDDIAKAEGNNFDSTKYAEKLKAQKDFGTGKQGDTTRSLNVVVDHLGVAQDAYDQLKNGEIKTVNKWANAIGREFGNPNVDTFDAAKQIVADEIAKAVIGGTNAEADRKGLQDALSTASTPETMTTVIKRFKQLMEGQLKGLRGQFVSSGAGDEKEFNKKLSPNTRYQMGDLPATNDKGWSLHKDNKGNFAYVGPNNEVEEVN